MPRMAHARRADAMQCVADTRPQRKWISHMVLEKDGITDPEGIKVRAVPGIKGVAYLDPGRITSELSWVFGPLIVNLKQLGYNDTNLQAASVCSQPLALLIFRSRSRSREACTHDRGTRLTRCHGCSMIGGCLLTCWRSEMATSRTCCA